MKKILVHWLSRYRADLIGWTLFLTYEITMVGLISRRFGHPSAYVVHYGINILVFYLHALYLFPWAIEKGWAVFWRIPIVLVLQTGCYTLASFGADLVLISWSIVSVAAEFKLDQRLILTSSYRCLYFLGFATGYYYIAKTLRMAKVAAQSEKQVLLARIDSERELSKVQNAFLKAQINPHFLFNTLDFVYHMIHVEANKASEAIVLLSRMMRYGVSSNIGDGFVLLEQEVEQIENLLYIHQLRKEGDRPILLDCDPLVAGIRFIPMVLLTLVENMLKHGQLDCAQTDQAWIRLDLYQGQLRIQTDNLIAAVRPVSGEGIGVENVRMRLRLAYGSSMRLNVKVDDRSHFRVELCVPLQCLAVHGKPEDSGLGNDRSPLHASAGRL